MDNIMVSIFCLTYNHKNYIKDTIKGFVSQKTNFKFEILIHDDASTDGTTEIVRQYAEMYPDIIVPIIQTENQYSKGVKLSSIYLYPRCRGKYIAFCEGDDYWCDENKLQKQVDFMENHMDYSAIAHETLVRDLNNGTEYIYWDVENDCDCSPQDIIEHGRKTILTSSILLRSEYYIIPNDMSMKHVGDYPLQVWLIIHGKIRMMNEVMSVYRYNVPGSWTVKTHYGEDHIHKEIEFADDCINMLKRAEHYANGLYEYEFEKNILSWTVNKEGLLGNYKKIWKEYRNYIKSKSLKTRLAYWLIAYMPQLYNFLKKMEDIHERD